LPQRTPARSLRRTSTDAERALWYHLRARRLGGYKFRRQSPVGEHVADFACLEARLIVELDGGQHFDPESVTADARRTVEMEAVGYHVMRFTNREVLGQMEAVLEAILHWLTKWKQEVGGRQERS
jgi:adenine-specific DNA-methyltransferase